MVSDVMRTIVLAGGVLASVAVFLNGSAYAETLLVLAVPLNILVVVFAARSPLKSGTAGVFCVIALFCVTAVLAHVAGEFALLAKLLPLLVNLPPICLVVVLAEVETRRSASKRMGGATSSQDLKSDPDSRKE